MNFKRTSLHMNRWKKFFITPTQIYKFISFQLSSTIRIVEVAPRDGLQNEKKIISTQDKIKFIDKLSQTGLHYIETTSFVSPEWIPQLADSEDVVRGIKQKKGVTYSALVPNLSGLHKAICCDMTEIAIFGATTDSFSKSNINCTVEESFKRFKMVLDRALQSNMKVRGYVSCVIQCPYEGNVSPQRTGQIVSRLLDMGCYEISLGDTIGAGTVDTWQRLITTCNIEFNIPLSKLAIHCHDVPLGTSALTNIETALKMGIRVVDSSVAAIGGCPYADGKSRGNVATEDVVHKLHALKYETGVDLEKLVETGNFIAELLGKENKSRYAQRLKGKLTDEA